MVWERLRSVNPRCAGLSVLRGLGFGSLTLEVYDESEYSTFGPGCSGLVYGGCTTAPVGQTEQATIKSDAWSSLTDLKQHDPSMESIFEERVWFRDLPQRG